jgi:hypothetical protein
MSTENSTAPLVTEEVVTDAIAPQQPSAVTTARKRVVIGLPGTKFSHNFMLSLIQTLYSMWESNKYEVVLAPGQSSYVSFARMKTMGLDVLRGKDQKPFNGMSYDVYVTLDSDMVFTPQALFELIDSTDIHPVVAGYYMMSDMQHFAVVKDWNTEYFAQTGSFQFLTPKDMKAWTEETKSTFMPVSYSGMGAFAIRKEVLDALQYPYFDAEVQEIATADGKVLRDLCSEDVALCKNIQKAGFTVYVHTGLRFGHEKSLVI